MDTLTVASVAPLHQLFLVTIIRTTASTTLTATTALPPSVHSSRTMAPLLCKHVKPHQRMHMSGIQ
jgi:hypothetical protein